jgi:predicted nucleotidyltransferase
MAYKEIFHLVIEKLLEKLKEYYGERLISVGVFGSVARGKFHPDSDIDVLIVVNKLPPGRRARIEEFIENIETPLENRLSKSLKVKYLPEISPVIKTPEEVEVGSPIFLDMTEEALILYDRNSFLENYLDRLRKRLNALGARRVFTGGGWYWILKPDYKPGSVIEL